MIKSQSFDFLPSNRRADRLMEACPYTHNHSIVWVRLQAGKNMHKQNKTKQTFGELEWTLNNRPMSRV